MRTKLKSKKNDVYLVNGNQKYILKKYKNESAYRNELQVLLFLEDTGIVPSVLSHDSLEQTISMTYLCGITALEKMVNYELEYDTMQDENIIYAMKSLLLEMTRKVNVVHQCYSFEMQLNDMNFSNFIVDLDNVHIIDLETTSKGNYKSDYFDLLAMFLSYSPEHSDFKNKTLMAAKDTIKENLDLKELDFKEALDEALVKVAKRRCKIKEK